jgi:hypothetical protein
MKKIEKIHPAIYDLKVDMDKGKITRPRNVAAY